MSYLGIVVASVFSSNALLAYGLGSPIPPRRRPGGAEALAAALALAAVNAVASSLLWGLRRLVLAPLGFAQLDVFFFALLAVPAVKFLARALSAGKGEGLPSKIGARSDDLVVGSLVFGLALIVARGGYSPAEAVAASAASGLGYWLSLALLEALRERLELSDLPAPLKGSPAMLVSAGLMAMAFMGIDAAFAANLAGAR